jgi:hypothetical protein
MIARLVLLLAMVLAVAGAVPGAARADWDDRPDPSEFEQALSPSGYWVDEPQFGHVWRPYVDWGWRPYVDGHWAWTSYGWTWVSDEDWGWTFHYGRWGFSNLYGWVWTPGVVWGPAWVDWFWGDGFVGWVPLGPRGFVVVPTYWTYVHDYAFCAPRVTNVIVVHDRLPTYIVHHREHGWGRERAPDFRDIEHVSRHRIEQMDHRPERSIAPWVRNRLDRGERVRERVAEGGHERLIEHGGRPAPERGGRPGADRGMGPGRPGVADDGGHGPALGHRGPERGPQVIEGDRDRGRVVEPRRDAVDGGMRYRPPDGSDGASRGGFPDRGRGWSRPPVYAPEPRPAPRPQGLAPPSPPPPGMPYHGAGSTPPIIERRGPGGGGERSAPPPGRGEGHWQHGGHGGAPGGGGAGDDGRGR